MSYRISQIIESFLVYSFGVFASLIVLVIILLVLGYSPLMSLSALLHGGFGTAYNISQSLNQSAIFLLCALAFILPAKSRFYNIGAEGQMYLGALIAFLVGSQLGNFHPAVAITLTALAGFAGGMLWIAVPVLMKVKLQINEIFTTMIFNFIAINLVNWLTAGPLKDPYSYHLQTPPLPPSTWLPVIVSSTELNAGISLSLVLALATYILLEKTIIGLEIKATGFNPRAARALGVKTTFNMLIAALIGAGFAGLAGMIVVTTGSHILTQNFSPGYGYLGIAIAALSNFNPLGAMIASFFYAALWVGGMHLQFLPGKAAIPVQLIYVFENLIVIIVLVVKALSEERRRILSWLA